jgi:hypothetical protein
MPRYSPAQFRSPVRMPELRPGATDLQPGEVLQRGQQITANNSRFVFVFQTDGNVVLYVDGRAVWATGTNGSNAQQLIMQTDGNLVLYGPGATVAGNAIWSSGTQGHPGAFAVLQDDSNFVVYDGAQPLWATKQHEHHSFL